MIVGEHCSRHIAAMAPGEFVDMESSTKVWTTSPRAPIADGIFEEALAASRYDSDGEDPFGPQPKQFMQTEHQKKQQKRALEIRQMAWILRKMRKTCARHCPIRKLPSELVLKLMQHTHPQNLIHLVNSSAIIRNIFRANKKAVFRGIEVEQFLEWKWLFGDTNHRTPAQSQHLKDAILSEHYSPDSEALGWTDHKQLFDILQTVDDNNFTGVRNVGFLRQMQSFVNTDIYVLNWETETKIARRTAIFLRSLSFRRLNEEDWTEDMSMRTVKTLTWEARSQLFNEQPASIQAEIRSILKIVVTKYYQRLEQRVLGWLQWHYMNPNNRRAPQVLKKWLSKFMTGTILELVIPQWYSARRADSPTVHFDWWFPDSFMVLACQLAYSLNQYNMGMVGMIENYMEGLEFGKSVGLDVEGLLEGTMAGDCLSFSV